MKKLVFLAGCALLSPTGVSAETLACSFREGRQVFELSSVSDAKSYGILLAAPRIGCGWVRFRIEDVADGFLGQTRALAPGELDLVRIGRGFAEGGHALTITAEGCATVPVIARRVTLAKSSPDHAARAARYGF